MNRYGESPVNEGPPPERVVLDLVVPMGCGDCDNLEYVMAETTVRTGERITPDVAMRMALLVLAQRMAEQVSYELVNREGGK